MANNKDMYIELANRIYDLDGEVYKCVGSSLGRTFTGSRENTIRALSMLMYTKPDGHLLRSELADKLHINYYDSCLLYTSPSPRDGLLSRMPSSA